MITVAFSSFLESWDTRFFSLSARPLLSSSTGHYGGNNDETGGFDQTKSERPGVIEQTIFSRCMTKSKLLMLCYAKLILKSYNINYIYSNINYIYPNILTAQIQFICEQLLIIYKTHGQSLLGIRHSWQHLIYL